MKAVRVHQYGGLEALKYEDVPVPEPGEAEVRVKVDPAIPRVRRNVGQRYRPFCIDVLINLCLTITWDSEQDAAAQCDEDGHARPAD